MKCFDMLSEKLKTPMWKFKQAQQGKYSLSMKDWRLFLRFRQCFDTWCPYCNLLQDVVGVLPQRSFWKDIFGSEAVTPSICCIHLGLRFYRAALTQLIDAEHSESRRSRSSGHLWGISGGTDDAEDADTETWRENDIKGLDLMRYAHNAHDCKTAAWIFPDA